MIVKNEEAYLSKCLESVKDIVSEIVIVDTGSTDSTVNIATSFNANIYDYQWEDNFSNARNYALSKSTCEWVLLLDADETLDPASKDKLLKFIKTSKLDGLHFTVKNFIGGGAPNQYTVHSAFRLLRNNGKYRYVGAIHEQIDYVSPSKVHISKNFGISDITINHYGYLDKTIAEKDKRKRNIPILLKELEKNPNDSFTLFNLGNEYLANKDIDLAIETYEKAFLNMDPSKAYGPHLIQRMGLCYSNLKRYEESLHVLDIGRNHYPLCTDFVLQKANIYKLMNNYVNAVEHYNKCLEMKDSPAEMRFSDGCSTYHPYTGLGDIYTEANCYEKALMCYSKALQSNPELNYLLYSVGECLNKLYHNKDDMVLSLNKYFADPNFTPNKIIVVDILTKTKNYEKARAILDAIDIDSESTVDVLFLKSTLDMYSNNLDDAYNGFLVCSQSSIPTVVADIPLDSLKNMMIIKIINRDLNCSDLLSSLYNYGYTIGNIYNIIYNITFGIQDNKALSDVLTEEEEFIINDYLTRLLILAKFDIFESSLQILNKTSDKSVLLLLGKIYYANDYKSLAANTILSSIKDLDSIDPESAFILSQTTR